MSALDEQEPCSDAVEAAIKAYYERRTRDGHVDAEAFLAEYPEAGDELREFLETVAELDLLAGKTEPFTPRIPSVQLREEPLGSVRYFGDYELLEELGRGGMGVVYRARQRNLNRTVAVKMLLAGQLASREDVDRFHAEAEAAANLRHRNIITIHEVGEHEGEHYFSMDYVGGGNLSEAVRKSPLPVRSAAEYVKTLAEAIAYAHSRGILHRDLKPSNVLLDSESGELRISDFGLSKQIDAGKRHTVSGQLLGTPSYSAPEQVMGKHRQVGPASDVYSLGAILYELLSMRPPFAGETPWDTVQLVIEIDPVAPSALNSKVPRDLETICLKCLDKAPSRRYASAQELAEDLERFLNGEPIHARAIGYWGRTWRWCKRNPKLAGAIGLAAISFAGFVVAVVASAGLRARSAKIEADALRRKSAIERLHSIRIDVHRDGWSREAWNQVREAAKVQPDGNLRDQAAAVLMGMDAQRWKQFDFPATSVAFDADGSRVLWGGGSDSPARLWDSREDVLRVSNHRAPGLVVFARDGSPWLVTAQSSRSLAIRDVVKNEVVRELKIPFPQGEQDDLGAETPLIASTPHGKWIAAHFARPEAQGTVTVWNTDDGRIVQQFAQTASAISLSPDGSLLATGDPRGNVHVWDVATGKTVARLRRADIAVTSIVFGRNARRGQDADESPWLLAAGDAGGTITIWDLQRRVPRNYCRGSAHHVYDLEFSPDGVTLASCGRYRVKLWDVAGGRLILDIEGGNIMYGLAFAPDGDKLAFTAVPAFDYPGRAEILQLENGRGIRVLRGLSTSVSRVWYSPSGKLIAALSHDWELGVWNNATASLMYVFEVPPGFFCDNADAAFSLDGRQLAFSSGEHATLWNLETGLLAKKWKLPPGLGDHLAFREDGRLLLFRTETRGSRLGPFAGAPPGEHPRVVRLRDLLSADPLTSYAEISDFNRHVYTVNSTSDGSFVVIDGLHSGPDGNRRTVSAFDGLTGRQVWSTPSHSDCSGETISIDPTGEVLLMSQDRGATANLVRLRSFQTIETRPGRQWCLSPGARYAFDGNPPVLLCGHNGEPLLQLGLGTPSDCEQPRFRRDGKQVAWGATDGTVLVCDLEAVFAKLAELGLVDRQIEF